MAEKNYCPKCKHFAVKSLSKRNARYGYCKKHKMPLLTSEVDDCKSFEKDE